MNYWHMQLHPGDYADWKHTDIRNILDTGLIGCSGDPVSQFYELKINDLVLIRHGGKVLSLVRITEKPRQTKPDEKSDFVWFDHCARIRILEDYEDKTVSGAGWFIPKTLMPVENEIAYNYIHSLWLEHQVKERIMKIENITSLLLYKKQVILQGPPGTGKTRLATELAKTLTHPKEISVKDIDAVIKSGIVLHSSTGYTQYTIGSITTATVTIVLEKGTSYSVSKNKIVEAYKRKLWMGGQFGGNDPYDAAIAKYIYENFDSSQYYKIIQFHPSYTYEDFVRGIIAKPNPDGPGLIYEAENKILAKLAEEAFTNFKNSEKKPEVISKELWVYEQYQKFKDSLEEGWDASGCIIIKPGTMPKITAIEDNAVRVNRYSNVNDSLLVKDSDIINGFIGLYLTNPHIKIRDNSSLTKTARSGLYYVFQNMIEKFKSFLDENKLSFISGQNTQQQRLRNYVLIIDEINRANLSSVLGELIYALEYRNEPVDSMYETDEGTELILPPNLFIIGTMNTSDRSVGHIDYAIRRRFAFVEVPPEILEENEEIYFDAVGFNKVAALFNRVNVSNEFEVNDVKIGHSYFIVKKEDAPDENKKHEIFNLKMTYEVIPILNEYVKDGILVGTIEGKSVTDYINELKQRVA